MFKNDLLRLISHIFFSETTVYIFHSLNKLMIFDFFWQFVSYDLCYTTIIQYFILLVWFLFQSIPNLFWMNIRMINHLALDILLHNLSPSKNDYFIFYYLLIWTIFLNLLIINIYKTKTIFCRERSEWLDNLEYSFSSSSSTYIVTSVRN